MGRPSITEQRRTEVLDAFVCCVAHYGLHGATLERLAEESGFKRPLIRHHLGNREEMVQSLAEHVVAKFTGQQQQMLSWLEDRDRIPALLDVLFTESTVTDADLVLAFAALTAQAEQDNTLRQHLLGSLVSFEQLLQAEIRAAFPGTTPPRVAAVAQGLMALYFNLDALSPLQPPLAWRMAARAAAEMLVAGADTGGDTEYATISQ